VDNADKTVAVDEPASHQPGDRDHHQVVSDDSRAWMPQNAH
jgi:hypothetical protein